MEDSESEDDYVNDDRALAVAGKRITCDELYLSDSDDSDVMSTFEGQPYLMDEVEEVEGALFELTHEHQLRVKDEIRSKISVLETALVMESENSTSSLLRVEKYKETRRELDKKFDTQYQRRIAEELDNHLTVVQQDRECRSQIEERKIRNDAANEEAKRKIALQEEKQHQEKAKAEAEVISNSKAPGSAPFASAYVIVLVTSQVPHAMDILLAELHRVCPYTVPKHMVYKKSTFHSREAYLKSIGYWEENGKMENTEDYLQRLESYVKMYAALVQTEVPKVQNLHGLQHGWAWLARFLNALPANQYTAVSLDAFLRMAGFALFRRYKSQFLKMLNVISENFLVDLKSLNAPELRKTVAEIQTYIEDKMFLQEPEGRSLQTNLLSKECVVR